jgi:hypothetical protein
MLSQSGSGPISNIPVKIEVSSQLIQIDLSEIRWHATEVILDLLQETYINGQGVETSAHFNIDSWRPCQLVIVLIYKKEK